VTPQEMDKARRALARWRESRRVAAAQARNEKAEVARIEAELALIAEELAAEGIDIESDVGMGIAQMLIKSRLGIGQKERSMYDEDSPRF